LEFPYGVEFVFAPVFTTALRFASALEIVSALKPACVLATVATPAVAVGLRTSQPFGPLTYFVTDSLIFGNRLHP
jgi:hypothetical protein